MTQPTRLLGFNILKIKAEKNPDFDGQLDVKSNINIIKIEKHKLDLAKQESLKIEFSFDINYSDLGKIALEGNMFIIAEPKLMKEVLTNWEDKKLNSELQISILNMIVQRASLKALQLEEELGLPPHIQFPRMKQPSEQN